MYRPHNENAATINEPATSSVAPCRSRRVRRREAHSGQTFVKILREVESRSNNHRPAGIDVTVSKIIGPVARMVWLGGNPAGCSQKRQDQQG
jgi:hypothetical protein